MTECNNATVETVGHKGLCVCVENVDREKLDLPFDFTVLTSKQKIKKVLRYLSDNSQPWLPLYPPPYTSHLNPGTLAVPYPSKERKSGGYKALHLLTQERRNHEN